MNKSLIFIESITDLKRVPHYKIICLALPNQVHSQMPMYFKKGINELEHEW